MNESTIEKYTETIGYEERAVTSHTWLLVTERHVSIIETWLNYSGVALIMLLMFFTTAEVASRYLLNRPFMGNLDITEMIMVVIVFFGAAYTQRFGSHITVDMFVKMLRGRLYHTFKSLGMALSLMVFAVIAIYGFKGSLEAWAYGDVTASILWPRWPTRLCLAIGSLLLCTRCAIQMLQHLTQAISGIERKDLV
ncbi:TRAP transporter small permease [Chloroflexota bacterium]